MKRSLGCGLCLWLMSTAGGAVASPVAPSSARILQMEDERIVGDGELERLVRSGETETRISAIRAAGRIGNGAVTGALVAALSDDLPEIRRAAAFALGEMEDGAAFDGLVGALSDGDPQTRHNAIEALGKLRDPRAEPPLRAILADAGSAVEDVGAIVLQIWRFRASESLGLVRGLLASPEVGLRRRAAYCLMRAGAELAVAELTAALADADTTVRFLAARALGNGADASAVPALLELLARSADEETETDPMSPSLDESSYLSASTPAWQVRLSAVRSLGRLKDPRAESALVERLEDPSGDVRIAAIESLAELGVASASPGVARMLAAPAPRFREAALDALVAIDTAAATRAVAALADDSAWVVQAARVRAMGKLGLAEGLLAELDRGFDRRVTPDVIGALVELGLPDMEQRLYRYLAESDPVVRSVAADRLAGVELTPPRVAGLLSAWVSSATDVIIDAKLSILSALASKLDEFAVRMVFFEALQNHDRLVRQRAVELLRGGGMKGDSLTVGSSETGRPLGFYAEVLAWAGSVEPQAVIDTGRGRVRIALFPAAAPLTVYNFAKLAQASYYDGQEFHRVVPGFVAQGGCPRGDGWGGPGYSVRCEINPRRFTRGAVGMALAGKDSGGSQFFFVKSDQPHLDGGYTVFGRVVEGMSVVDALVQGDAIRSITLVDVGELPAERVASTSPLARIGRNLEPPPPPTAPVAAATTPPRPKQRPKDVVTTVATTKPTKAPPRPRVDGPGEELVARGIIRPDSLGSIAPVTLRLPAAPATEAEKDDAAKPKRRRSDDYNPG